MRLAAALAGRLAPLTVAAFPEGFLRAEPAAFRGADLPPEAVLAVVLEPFLDLATGRNAASASARPMAAATSEIGAMPSTVRSAPLPL